MLPIGRVLAQEQRHPLALPFPLPLPLRPPFPHLLSQHYEKLGFDGLDRDTVTSIIGECAKFCENTLSPLNEIGDVEGCKLVGDDVKTPKGFKEAYVDYSAGGWQGLTVPEEYGGQGLPLSLGLIKAELVGTANWSFGMYPGVFSFCESQAGCAPERSSLSLCKQPISHRP